MQQLAGGCGQCWRRRCRLFFLSRLCSRFKRYINVLADTAARRHGQPLADITRLADLQCMRARGQA